MIQIDIISKQGNVTMAKIIEQSKATKKRIAFACPGDIKDDFDKAKKELLNYGFTIDIQEDILKVIKDATLKMTKQIEELESKTLNAQVNQ
ncbi:hypothetical protein yberc0001_38050 [Yersinia bercovieri ATCC 43970]|uniref:Uncharacterized protein n=2 Tax=Yersinia bercovieri TaxID=634 RepID=A0ABM9XTN3_YERBE|nr:hypothetical protein yberc0001_38050 [Yersinia bercovieri ATCC 43970]